MGLPSDEEHRPLRCEEGAHFHMQEVDGPDIDYSMLAVEPRNDRRFFIQSPPLPDLRERLCNSEWLEELAPEGPLQWFDFEPDASGL